MKKFLGTIMFVSTCQCLFAQSMQKDTTQLPPLEVRAIRASERAPFAKQNISKGEIQKNNLAKDNKLFIDKDAIKVFLKSFNYPYYYFDRGVEYICLTVCNTLLRLIVMHSRLKGYILLVLILSQMKFDLQFFLCTNLV